MVTQKMFPVYVLRFFLLEQWIIHHSYYLSAFELSGEKQPGLIISHIVYPFYSWKVYMENKNNTFSFQPTGSPQGSEARNINININKYK